MEEIAQVERLESAILGEGPAWNPSRSILSWVDIPMGRVHEYEPATGNSTHRDVEGAVGAALPAEGGGYVLGTDTGFWRMDDGGSLTLIAQVEADEPDRRMNDAKPDPAGRIWGGTLAQGFAPGSGSLWRLDTDGSIERVLTGLTIPNGMGWTPDGRGMWLIDSFAYEAVLYKYDVSDGALGDRITTIPLLESEGLGDGMCVDLEGGIWIARFGGWAIDRYDVAGVRTDHVTLPVSHPTSCAFGTSDLSRLYVTTSRSTAAGPRPDDELEDQPFAGSLFSFDPPVPGAPVALARIGEISAE